MGGCRRVARPRTRTARLSGLAGLDDTGYQRMAYNITVIEPGETDLVDVLQDFDSFTQPGFDTARGRST